MYTQHRTFSVKTYGEREVRQYGLRPLKVWLPTQWRRRHCVVTRLSRRSTKAIATAAGNSTGA